VKKRIIKHCFLFALFTILFLWACASDEHKNVPHSAVNDEKQPVTVGLYPLNPFDSVYLAMLKDEVEHFYGYKTLIMQGSKLPKSAYYAPRNRYRADSLLDYLLGVRPATVDYLVGLTQKDISCTSDPYPDWGVFGLGFMPGKSCVISTFRLRKGAKSEAHFRERLSKVVLHELGHNFGLGHCPNTTCFMHDAEGTIKSVDREQKNLCSGCKQRLIKLMQ
jgi:archaemetzincin